MITKLQLKQSLAKILTEMDIAVSDLITRTHQTIVDLEVQYPKFKDFIGMIQSLL